ncbi:MAG: hypothetical protein K0R20_159 [Actinomycetia bacterium]|jgi:hypothetical protein|nr:hypothetical protein [Actinomycetes bacterium]
MDRPKDDEIALARRLLMVVGLASLVAQLLAFSLDRPPSWDEAIYLSQVAPGAEALPFVPSRARGITFLAAPVLQLGGSLVHLRLFLVVASAVAMAAAFRSWAKVIGLGAVAAAVLFAGAWPALFYGSELMPNLWVALAGVAATAILARRLMTGEGRYDELLAGGLVAVAALLRPLDAVVLAAALILLPIALRRATIAWTVHIVLGLVAGWMPWLIEMIGRFGSPAKAFAAAARLGHTGHWALLENVQQYLALSDGPSIGPVAEPHIPASGILWLLGMTALVIVGIRGAAGARLLPSLVLPTATGAALAAEYIVFTDAQAPRFLLPALALLAIPAGLGSVWIVDRARDQRPARKGRWVVVVAASTLVFGWAFLQIGIAMRVAVDVEQQRATARLAGSRVRALAGREPCLVYSEASFPIVGYTAGCRAAPIGNVVRVWPERAARLERDGVRPFLVLHRAQQPAVPEGASPLATIPSDGQSSWFIYGTG